MDKDIVKGGVLGFCIGDALGVPVEFKSREYLKKEPVTDMEDFGTHMQSKGSWSDDSSMALCTLESLTECKGVDCINIADKFCKWCFEDYMTPKDEAFDCGNTVYQALTQYVSNKKISPQTDEYSNGNGSLMRILPLAFYLSVKPENKDEIIKEVSSITHGHQLSILGCQIYVTVAINLINGAGKIKAIEEAMREYKGREEYGRYSRIADTDKFMRLGEDEIRSSGYVVDTLEASLWCFLNTETYKECVLKAVNLGDDTDTTATVAGGLAGIFYGLQSIPEEWIEALRKHDMIENLCEDFAEEF